MRIKVTCKKGRFGVEYKSRKEVPELHEITNTYL